MKKTKIVVALSVAACALAGGYLALGTPNSALKSAFAENIQPKDITLELNASNVHGGSGSVVIYGNTFNYEGISVDGDNLILSSGAKITSAEASGNGAMGGLKGAGFNFIEAVGAANGNASIKINGAAHNLPVATGMTAGMAIAASGFDMQVTGGSITVSALRLKYTCKLADTVIDGRLDDAIWTSEVLSNPYNLRYSDNYHTEVYTTKTAEGIYLFAEQHVKTVRNVGNDWWQRDNIEFRIGSQFHAPREDRDQLWLSALKTSNFPHYAVTDEVYNEETGMYDINYEVFMSWAELGYVYEDDIVFTAGVAYDAGWCNGSGWYHVRLDNYRTITPTGVGTFSYAKVRSGVETVAAPMTQSGSGWNSNAFRVGMDGSDNWGIKVSYRSQNDPNGADPNAKGVVAEVFSPNWSAGGWTFRKDWWGWGSWTYDHRDGHVGGNAQVGFVDSDEIGNPWVNASCDIDVVAYIYFNKALGRITITATYTSNVAGYEGKRFFIEYSSANISHRGEMIYAMGYDGGTCTLNSLEVLTGSKLWQSY